MADSERDPRKQSRTDEIRERLERGTREATQWFAERTFGSAVTVYARLREDEGDATAEPIDLLEEPWMDPVELIAHAPDDIAYLLARAEAAELVAVRLREALGELADVKNLRPPAGDNSVSYWLESTHDAALIAQRALLDSEEGS